MRNWFRKKIKEVQEDQLAEYYEALGLAPERPNPSIPEKAPKSNYSRSYGLSALSCNTCGLAHDQSECHPTSCLCGRCRVRRRGGTVPARQGAPDPPKVCYLTVPYDRRDEYKLGDTVMKYNELYRVATVGQNGATPWGSIKLELVETPDDDVMESTLKSLVDILRETED